MNFCSLPIAALFRVVLEIVRGTEERPLQFGWRQVDAATVSVGFVGVQTIRTRATTTAVDDELLQIKIRRRDARATFTEAILEMLQ